MPLGNLILILLACTADPEVHPAIGSTRRAVRPPSLLPNPPSLRPPPSPCCADFDFGPDGFERYISKLHFPVVGSCNMDVSRLPGIARIMRNWTVLTVPGTDIRIGVVSSGPCNAPPRTSTLNPEPYALQVGVATNSTLTTSSPGPLLAFRDTIASVRG